MKKVITVYDSSKTEIVGLIVVDDLELGYIDKKIILFSTEEVKGIVFSLLGSFNKKCVNTREFNKTSLEVVIGTDKARFIHFLEPFEVKSRNKNKSSRYNRILDKMGLKHLERWEYNLCLKENK